MHLSMRRAEKPTMGVAFQVTQLVQKHVVDHPVNAVVASTDSGTKGLLVSTISATNDSAGAAVGHASTQQESQ